ncbi:MAG: GNAT family N-acetyltransferase [Alphaproteobacteria bacterium]|nr:GNAT family N-acetyltransferase [Alphaproteobacteria bacterium]
MRMRRARAADLPAIVALLADDMIGREREAASAELATLAPQYVAAFAAIEGDPHQLLAVAEGEGGAVIGTLQLSFIPGLSRRGLWRGQIESVRVASSERGGGIGRQMFEWAIAQCRERGCGLVQLTSDKRRPAAHRFYETLGFVASHEGYKLDLG